VRDYINLKGGEITVWFLIHCPETNSFK